LARSAEEAWVRDRHLAHYLAFAQRAEPELRGSDRQAWIARLSTERDNFLAAHAWCALAERAEDGLLLLDALRMWLYATSIELGSRIAREALAWPSAGARTRARCLAVHAAASIEYFAGRYADAVAHARECVSIAEEIGDEAKAVDGLAIIGAASTGIGDRIVARRALVDALDRARALNDPTRLGAALVSLGEVYTLDGEPALAIPVYEQAAAILRAAGDVHSVVVNACNIARNHVMCGAGDKAKAPLSEAASLVDPAMPDQAMQVLLVVHAGLAAAGGDWARAARFGGAAQMDLDHRGAMREPADDQFLQPVLASARTHLGEAAFDEAMDAGRALTYAAVVSEIRQ
jgi:tetratricopeptide (TPR) repeat protein